MSITNNISSKTETISLTELFLSGGKPKQNSFEDELLAATYTQQDKTAASSHSDYTPPPKGYIPQPGDMNDVNPGYDEMLGLHRLPAYIVQAQRNTSIVERTS